MLETIIILLLVIGAVVVLATAWWSGRTRRDPRNSVATFSRALDAMQPGSHRAAPARPDDEEHVRP